MHAIQGNYVSKSFSPSLIDKFPHHSRDPELHFQIGNKPSISSLFPRKKFQFCKIQEQRKKWKLHELT
uniref:Uncharacterized protein n=1 Tax=Arundo donax TaxID=35708 RepID=A0A0A8ZQP1_ARUDO